MDSGPQPEDALCTMKLATYTVLLAMILLTPACEMLGGDTAAAPNITELLAGITDMQSAEQAKAPLESAVSQLQSALSSKMGAGTESGGSMVDSVLAQFGITPETKNMITGLLGNDAIRGAIGPTLETLQGLLPAM